MKFCWWMWDDSGTNQLDFVNCDGLGYEPGSRIDTPILSDRVQLADSV